MDLIGEQSFDLAVDIYDRYCVAQGTDSLASYLQVKAVSALALAIHKPDWYSVSPDLQGSITEVLNAVGLEGLAVAWYSTR